MAFVPGGCHSAFRGEVMGLGGAVHSIKKGYHLL